MGVATTVAVGGLIISAATATASFAQADKQKRLMNEAETKAAKALEEAKKLIDVNYMEQLSIAKDPYRLAREAGLVSSARALEAGREGDERGAAATAGRVLAGQQEGQQKIASLMSTDIASLDKAVATEDAAIAKSLSGISLSEAEGAQIAANNANSARNAAIQNGIKATGDLATGALGMADLYPQTKHTKQRIEDEKLGSGMSTMGMNEMKPIQMQPREEFVPRFTPVEQTSAFNSSNFNVNPFWQNYG